MSAVTAHLPATSAVSLHDLTFDELKAVLVKDGVRPAHTPRLWNGLHRHPEVPVTQREDFLPPLRRWVAERVGTSAGWIIDSHLDVVTETQSSDGLTRKLLLRLRDGQTIETVVMGYPGRFTACLSTQVGCAMGCVFCATGQRGFTRHLRPGEIVGQVLAAQRALRAAGQAGLRNLVLMGMGEPLHNYDAVMRALEIISDTRGINIGPSKITLSTVGVVPGIRRMADEARPFKLAVSLHGASEEQRSRLVPISRKWPLDELIDACRDYGTRTGQRIFFEWTLVSGANDSPEIARQLARLLHGIDAHINLIPLNPTPGFTGSAPDLSAADSFQAILQNAGFPSTIRQRRGIDVAAGCGQLRAEVE